MKVYISNYRNHWLSPYTIAEKLCFWREIDYDEPWVKKFNDVLDPVMQFVNDSLNKIHPRINYVKIDYYDTWSMDATLSPIILPMLKQLRAKKHGCPWTYHEDGPWYYRFQTDKNEYNYTDEGSHNHERWNWIMDEMIWTFEQFTKENYEDQYWHDYGDIDWTAGEVDENGCKPVVWKRESVVDWDGIKRHDAAIENGLRLFGKYYRALWD